jgi:hypothetical protein
VTSLSASSPGAPPDGVSPAPAAAGTPPGRNLPLTLGRRLALAFGVPAVVLVIIVTSFNLVGNLGKASYPVSRTLPVVSGRLALNLDGGDVDVSGGGTPGVATLTGRVYYSLVRPRLFLNPRDSSEGGAASVRLGCSFLSMAGCGINAHLGVPAGTAVTASTGGGNITVRGLSGAVSVSTGGGDVNATDLPGAVTVSTGGGNVTVGQLTGTVSLHTGGGDITGAAITAGDVTAATGGGNVQLTFTAVPANLSVNTSGGDITIIVPPGVSYDVTTHTDGGSVSDSVPESSQSRHKITATTGGGNITIESAA